MEILHAAELVTDAGPVVPETVVIPDDKALYPIVRRQNLQKIEGRQQRHLAGEIEKNHPVYPRLSQKRFPFLGRGEHAEGDLRAQYLLGVGAKGNDRRRQSPCSRLGLNPCDDGPVPPVHAVEHAQRGEERLLRIGFGIFGSHWHESTTRS